MHFLKVLACMCLLAAATAAQALDLASTPITEEDWTALLDVLACVESDSRTDAIVLDSNGRLSVGCLQIQQPYLTDSRLGYTLHDMLGKEASYEVARAYLMRYGAAYTRRTGKPATVEVLIRIHNGGPFGAEWMATLAYLERVRTKML